MKPIVTDSTHEAIVRLQYDDGAFKSEQYKTLIKLVEARMDGKMREFYTWFGVAEIAIEFDDYMAAMQKGDPNDFCLYILLEDGRHGLARQLDAHLVKSEEDQYSTTHVSFVGVTQLKTPCS